MRRVGVAGGGAARPTATGGAPLDRDAPRPEPEAARRSESERGRCGARGTRRARPGGPIGIRDARRGVAARSCGTGAPRHEGCDEPACRSAAAVAPGAAANEGTQGSPRRNAAARPRANAKREIIAVPARSDACERSRRAAYTLGSRKFRGAGLAIIAMTFASGSSPDLFRLPQILSAARRPTAGRPVAREASACPRRPASRRTAHSIRVGASDPRNGPADR
jgi:hypothetical protein